MGRVSEARYHMRKLSVITATIIFLIALSATSVSAQFKRTSSSERAAYGLPSETFSTKKHQKRRKSNKKRHKSKKKKDQPANKNKKPLFRKKSPWVN
ncbi:MAG: hypothetical protein ABIS36_10665 [Chryseolinea sp.]